MTRKLTSFLSGVLFLLALVSIAFLVLPDVWQRFAPSVRHQQAAAFALIFAGASFGCFQISLKGLWKGKLRGLLLGMAFVLWGSEQYLPPGRWVAGIDCVVVVIFVVDLGLVIWSERSRRPAVG